MTPGAGMYVVAMWDEVINTQHPASNNTSALCLKNVYKSSNLCCLVQYSSQQMAPLSTKFFTAVNGIVCFHNNHQDNNQDHIQQSQLTPASVYDCDEETPISTCYSQSLSGNVLGIRNTVSTSCSRLPEIIHHPTPLEHEHDHSLSGMNDNTLPPSSEILRIHHFRNVRVLCLDGILGHLLITELRRSTAFQNNFRNYAQKNSKLEKCQKLKQNSFDGMMASCDKDSFLVILKMGRPSQWWIDYKWTYRVCELVHKAMQLYDAMNWLSTLGGGYSALGDYFSYHAEEAGRISVQQLRVALQIGDPPTVIRCHLYYALSRMQTGQLRTAKAIIRRGYKEAKSLPVIDHRLLAMCQGVWSKLRYIYQSQPRAHRETS